MSSLRAGLPLITSVSLALGLGPRSAELGLKECCPARLWLHARKRPMLAEFLPPASFMQGLFVFVYFKQVFFFFTDAYAASEKCLFFAELTRGPYLTVWSPHLLRKAE